MKEPPIPGYEPVRFLGYGCGGVGCTIHLARKEEGDVLVVLRVFHRRPPDPWLETATAQRRLRHSNILGVIDVGESGGRWYQAIEHCGSQTLTQKLESGPLLVLQAMSLSRGLALAMQHARHHGLTCLGLSSGKILLTEDGVLKLCALDFKPPSAITGPERLADAAFMPPEWLRGGDLESSPAADVYRVGVAMYAMLTGRAPFDGDSNVVVAQRVLRESPAPVGQVVAGIPTNVETICMKCLARSPQDRYPTLDDLAEAVSSS